MPRVVEWTEPPQMDTGAPMPAIERAGDSLVVAYICKSTSRPNSSAVVRFRGVSWVQFGPPSDERLPDHPLYQFGLSFYAFLEVLDSPRIQRLARSHANTSNQAMEPTANRPYAQISLLMNAARNSRGGSSWSR
jgi:hypothetical protein